MKKLTLILTAIGLSILLSVPVFAVSPREGKGTGDRYKKTDDRGSTLRGLNRLNLSAEQKAKIEALNLAHQQDIRPIREKMADKSVELRRLWLQTDPARNKISAKQKEVRTLRDQLEDKKTAYRFEINKVLTPEQKEKLAAYGLDRKTGYGPRGGKRGKGASGPGMCF
ncbi:MAG: Spy/CpxP family protein refolding chaperone [Smithella sp.]|nr:Spy/CpxP family protein refolding chaperone [Smithella sp.]